MAYAKQYFVDGEVLNADQLNHMEEGIYQNEEKIVEVEKTVSGTYELVEEITTTEELANVNRTAWPDGTPYNFKAVYVVATVPPAPTAGNINIYSMHNGVNVGMVGMAGLHATSTRYVNYYTYQIHNLWETRGGACGGKYGSGDSRYYTDVPNFTTDHPAIDRVRVAIATTGAVIPVGTTIKIYGVRA